MEGNNTYTYEYQNDNPYPEDSNYYPQDQT